MDILSMYCSVLSTPLPIRVLHRVGLSSICLLHLDNSIHTVVDPKAEPKKLTLVHKPRTFSLVIISAYPRVSEVNIMQWEQWFLNSKKKKKTLKMHWDVILSGLHLINEI